MTKPKEPEIEFRSDGWERFQRAFGIIAKSAPRHRKAKSKRDVSKASPKLRHRKARDV